MTTGIRSDATKSVIQVNGVDQLGIGSQGELYANHGADAGTAGQVLTSGGAGQPAVWGAKSTISTAAPSGGSAGDVWYVV